MHQNVVEPKVHLELKLHTTYVNFNFSKKLSISPRTLHTYSN